jgi:tRNA(Arg) A34 adenosine deaminase TadA
MPIKERFSELSKRDVAFLERATLMANLSDCKQKHAAIIVKGGRIIGSGVNTFRNNPITDFPDDSYSYHAEIAALRSIKKYRQIGKIDAGGTNDLSGARIYVARVSRRGRPALSRPCDSCYPILIASGIKEVIYTS